MIVKSKAWVLLAPVFCLAVSACNQHKSSPEDNLNLTVKPETLAPQNPTTGSGNLGTATDSAPGTNGKLTPANGAGNTAATQPANTVNDSANAVGDLPVGTPETLDQKVLTSSTNALQNIDPALFNIETKQTRTPDPTDADLPKIQIEDAELLKRIDTSTELTLFQNSLNTKTRAMSQLIDRGQGIYCQTADAAQFKKGDVLAMVDGDVKPAENDKTVNITTFIYQTATKKSLKIICTTRGKVSTQEYQDNFKQVLTFQEPEQPGASTAPNGSRRETAEEMEANNIKMLSFKIVNPDVFAKTIVGDTNINESLALSAGKLVKAADIQTVITEGKAEQACQIAKYEGELTKKAPYLKVDSSLMAADQTRRTALLAYTYATEDKKHIVTLYCFVRMSTSAIEIFNTFKGVLEFGAAKPQPTSGKPN